MFSLLHYMLIIYRVCITIIVNCCHNFQTTCRNTNKINLVKENLKKFERFLSIATILKEKCKMIGRALDSKENNFRGARCVSF